MEYFHDPSAPAPNVLVPAAFAVVRDDTGRVLLWPTAASLEVVYGSLAGERRGVVM